MSSVLDDMDWIELDPKLSSGEMLRSHDLLTYAIPAVEARESKPILDSSGRGFTYTLEMPRVSMRPSTLQFFYDLFHLGAASLNPYNDVLVSYLHLSDSNAQSYEKYPCSSAAETELFFKAISEEPALIFPGRFQTFRGRGATSVNTQEAFQRTWNGICIDLDPVPDEDGVVWPMDSCVLEHVFHRCDPRLLPNYVCLTGRGLHLWYVFDRPLQTFRRTNPRRRRFKALAKALYSYFDMILDGQPCVLDTHCSSLNHGFRAPGSLTKRGEIVSCFCPVEAAYRHSTCDPLSLSSALAGIRGVLYPADLVLSDDDVRWKSYEDLALERKARHEDFDSRPASEDQLSFIQSLSDQGLISMEELDDALSFTAHQASDVIRQALSKRDSGHMRGKRRPPELSEWRTKPHTLTSGATGGVYRVVLQSLPKVPQGRRYLSMYMCAGVAYMMDRPIVSRKQLEDDFTSLLETPWAKAGTPLTRRDVANALLGYKESNWQSRASICATLGFDPFGASAKRNGRKRREHLETVASPAADKARRERSLTALKRVLSAEPDISQNAAAKRTGLSRTTVRKYWAEAKDAIGINNPNLEHVS